MKFTTIVDELNGAKNAGYTFCEDTDREIDQDLYKKLRTERGGRWVDSQLDSLYDFDSSLYQGEDGNMYAVKMIYSGDCWIPLAWHKLTKKGDAQ